MNRGNSVRAVTRLQNRQTRNPDSISSMGKNLIIYPILRPVQTLN